MIKLIYPKGNSYRKFKKLQTHFFYARTFGRPKCLHVICKSCRDGIKVFQDIEKGKNVLDS